MQEESHRTRVLIVGPVTGRGGMARVAQMTVDAGVSADADVATCDTTKDTPEDRSVFRAVGSHVRRQWRLVRSLIRHKPHVVHIHTCSYQTFYRTVLDCVTCTLFHRPYVLHIHGGLFAEFLSQLKGWRRLRVVSALCRAARVVVLGECWRRDLGRLVAGLKLTIIPNAVECDGPVPEEAPRGGGVLFVGDLSEVKRPEDLLVAYAALPSVVRRQYRLTIVGGGSWKRWQWLVRLADRIGVQEFVHFPRALSRGDVADAMSRADLLVMPSRAEGMPMVLLEAMRAALPCVVTDVGAVGEMVQDGVEACIVPPRDHKALLDAMHALLTDSEKRRAMGRAAALRVRQQFSAGRFHQLVGDVWCDVAAEQVPAQRQPVPRLAASPLRSIL